MPLLLRQYSELQTRMTKTANISQWNKQRRVVCATWTEHRRWR